MIRPMIVVCLLAFAAAGAQAGVPAGFYQYVSEEDSFTVCFPGRPEFTDFGIVRNYASVILAEGAYNVHVGLLPYRVTSDNEISSVLQEKVRGKLMGAGPGAQLIYSRQANLLGYQGREYEYTVTHKEGIVSWHKGVSILSESRTYSVTCVASSETKEVVYGKYAKMLDTFSLTRGSINGASSEAVGSGEEKRVAHSRDSLAGQAQLKRRAILATLLTVLSHALAPVLVRLLLGRPLGRGHALLLSIVIQFVILGVVDVFLIGHVGDTIVGMTVFFVFTGYFTLCSGDPGSGVGVVAGMVGAIKKLWAKKPNE